jgi:hypothetical protein
VNTNAGDAATFYGTDQPSTAEHLAVVAEFEIISSTLLCLSRFSCKKTEYNQTTEDYPNMISH